MSKTETMSWPFWAGVAMAGAAALLAMLELRPGGSPLVVSALLMVAAAVLEVSGGVALFRHGGAGISHAIIGGVALLLSLVLLVVWRVFPMAFQAGTVTMLLGVVFLATSIACGLDLFIDRPRARAAQGLEVGVTFALAVFALWGWRMSTPAAVAGLICVELVFSGVALAATAASLSRHPEQAPYDDYAQRFTTRRGLWASVNATPGA